MDLLTAILACSLYRDDALVRAIAETNSRGNPYAVLDATLRGDATEQPAARRSLQEAAPLMREIIELGGQPLLGLMQIPARWAAAYQRRPEDLFDPCTNIAVGTAKLSELAYECSHPPKLPTNPTRPRTPRRIDTTRVRRCVIRKYAKAIRMPEFEVVVRLELDNQRPFKCNGDQPVPIIAPNGRSIFFRAGSNEEGEMTNSVLVDPFAQHHESERNR